MSVSWTDREENREDDPESTELTLKQRNDCSRVAFPRISFFLDFLRSRADAASSVLTGELMKVDSSSSDVGLERYRNYLCLLARQHLNPRLRGKLDASDIVQDVLLQAHLNRNQYRGTSEPERLDGYRPF